MIPDPPTPHGGEVPDYCEPLLAFRVWTVDGDGLLLSAYGTRWQPYQALEGKHAFTAHSWDWEAGKRKPECPGTPCDGHIPNLAPKCGIYGFKTADALRKQWTDASWLTGSEIIGAVWFWGRVVEHEFGYRAQFAYPAYFLHGIDCDAAAVAKTYGVDYREDPSWKSERQFDAWWLSHCVFPFPTSRVCITNKNQAVYLFSNPSPLSSQWVSRYLHPPSSLSLLKKPKKRLAQPSFNLYKPTNWYYDKGRKMWLRVDPKEDDESSVSDLWDFGAQS